MKSAQRTNKPGKQTVSLTIDSDVYAQAKKLGINASQVAEAALAAEVTRHKTEQLRAEIAQDLDAISEYEAKHGSFAAMAREHYRRGD
ncbi:MAG TPA: type II toxin-antitoxin system CcdA family antitoxin [Kofleriaceae bacterium]|nr:type II toxin-antitoxin system CcdA family antitoxin [Kofleriaceae bacterium]